MFDLLITYLNFLLLSIKYLVRVLAFRPPNPKGVRIIENKEKKEENINDNNNIEILYSVPVKKDNDNNKIDLNKNNDINNKNNDINNKNNNTTPPENKQNIKKKFEYKIATDRFASFQLVFLEDNETKITIPAFIFRPKDFNQFNCIIIYCHGNSGDIGTSFLECQILSRNVRCDVLSFEYPGYGLSNDYNNTNEKRSYIYIRQAYKYARDKLGYQPENIIIYGFSLGTGIAFDLACDKKYPNGGVILQSPFLSIIRIFYNFNKTYYFDIFNSCDKAKFCESTIYIIHGTKDSIVPYIHGRILAKLIPKKYLYGFYTVPDANHNDLIKFAREQLYNNIGNFIFDMLNKVPYLDDKNNITQEDKNIDKAPSEMDISYTKSDIKINSSLKNFIKEKPKKVELEEKNDNISSKEKLNEKKENNKNKSIELKHEMSNLFPKEDDKDTVLDVETKNVELNDINITIKKKTK